MKAGPLPLARERPLTPKRYKWYIVPNSTWRFPIVTLNTSFYFHPASFTRILRYINYRISVNQKESKKEREILDANYRSRKNRYEYHIMCYGAKSTETLFFPNCIADYRKTEQPTDRPTGRRWVTEDSASSRRNTEKPTINLECLEEMSGRNCRWNTYIPMYTLHDDVQHTIRTYSECRRRRRATGDGRLKLISHSRIHALCTV